jgi:hypothetical protein
VNEDTKPQPGSLDLVAETTLCRAEFQDRLHVHRCIKPQERIHLHLCCRGAFWPLGEFENIVTESARDLYEALI